MQRQQDRPNNLLMYCLSDKISTKMHVCLTDENQTTRSFPEIRNIQKITLHS